MSSKARMEVDKLPKENRADLQRDFESGNSHVFQTPCMDSKQNNKKHKKIRDARYEENTT